MEATIEKTGVQKYAEYKDSGFEWLGSLPEHWNIIKGKWLFEKQKRAASKEAGIVTAFRDGEVTLRSNRREEGFTNALKEHGYQGVKKGDLVIHAMDAFAGAIGVSDSDGKSSPVYSVCAPRRNISVNSFYYAYFLRNLAKNGFIESLAKGIRERSTDFRFNDFGELLVPIPPLEEQTRIVNFLDKKTEQIDKAIAQKQKLIELLKEKRQIMIRKAVIRGLNPEVPMKDSGVEWIGEIPEHWEVKAIKHAKRNSQYSFVDGPFGSNLKSEHFIANGDVYVVESGFITTGVFLKKSFKTISINHFNKIRRSECRASDIIIAKIGANFGMAAELPLLDKRSVVSGNCLKLTLNQKIIANDLFVKFMELAKYSGGFNDIVNVSAQPALSLGGLNNLKLPVPPLHEQDSITKYINNIEVQIRKSSSQLSIQIEKLKELKSSLINSAVAGKIKI